MQAFGHPTESVLRYHSFQTLGLSLCCWLRMFVSLLLHTTWSLWGIFRLFHAHTQRFFKICLQIFNHVPVREAAWASECFSWGGFSFGLYSQSSCRTQPVFSFTSSVDCMTPIFVPHLLFSWQHTVLLNEPDVALHISVFDLCDQVAVCVLILHHQSWLCLSAQNTQFIWGFSQSGGPHLHFFGFLNTSETENVKLGALWCLIS